MCWKGEGERYPELEEFIEQVKSIVELLGEDAVAIGTDFHAMDEDGAHYLQANRERMVSRFPAITGRYVNAFGNAADNRYCRGFDNVRSWRSLPEVLAHEGFGDRVVSKLVAENWLRVCRQVWEARE
jgi:membrane dipeptidase